MIKDENLEGEKIEFHAEQQDKKETILRRSERKIKGLIMFEYNEVTKELKPAEFVKQHLTIKYWPPRPEDLITNSRINVKENCVYVQALNEGNALKKVKP